MHLSFSSPDWSLLYVAIAMVIILIVAGLVVWGVKCCICGRGGGRRKSASSYLRKKQTANNKPLKYSLLETNERKERVGESRIVFTGAPLF